MRIHRAFRPKPSRLMMRAMLARERVPRGRAVLVEDSPSNLKAARALGFRTVLLSRHGATPGWRRPVRGSYVDLHIASIHHLPRRLARLRR
jgi:putative hydrolase of the HAD superfamily